MARKLKAGRRILELSCTLMVACSAPGNGATVDGLTTSAGAYNPSEGIETPEPEVTPDAAPSGMPGDMPGSPPGGGNDNLLVDSAEDEEKPAVVNQDTACAGSEVAPEKIEVEVVTEIEVVHEELKPVAIYVVLDNSLSMDSFQGGGDKWTQAVNALTGFVSDPASEGIGMAIQYFHPLGAGAAPDECDGSGHGIPHVPMDILPNNADALLASLDAAGPEGYTPTVGALRGGVQYCDAYQQSNPDTSCVVVLVTDGQPVGCGLCETDGRPQTDCFDPESESVLAPIAADGLAADVKTFTVGMAGVTEEGFALLNAIAVAGGTDCTPDQPGSEGCDVSETGTQGFADALNAIRDSVTVTETITEIETVTETQTLDCEWGIPEPPEGDKFNPELVNVKLSVEGGEAVDIGAVESVAACDATGGFGWYYDNPEAPGLIQSCPASCNEIKSATDPVVQVLLGCQTVPQPPR